MHSALDFKGIIDVDVLTVTMNCVIKNENKKDYCSIWIWHTITEFLFLDAELFVAVILIQIYAHKLQILIGVETRQIIMSSIRWEGKTGVLYG